MSLANELANDPAGLGYAQHIAAGDGNAIMAILTNRNISTYGKISVGVFADWLAVTGLRSAVEDHAANQASALRANALSILDLLRGSHEYQMDFGQASKRALLQQWVTNGSITEAQQSEVLFKAATMISRAEQLGITVTQSDIERAIKNDDGTLRAVV